MEARTIMSQPTPTDQDLPENAASESSAPAAAAEAPEPPFDWVPWFWGGLLVLLVAIVYSPVRDNGYIWDDDSHVITNVTLRTGQGLHDMWLRWGAIPQYYPLTHTALWIEYQLWGLQPRGYHIVNVVLHATAVVLLWRVLLRLAVPGAWLIAAIFAVHPVCVESVAWISEQKNVLSCALALGSILMYLRYSPPEQPADAARPNQGWDYELALGLFVAALLSKTVTAVVPALLLCIYWWKRGRITRREFGDMAPMFVFGAVLGCVTVWLELSFVGAEGAEWDLSLIDRLLVAGRALWFYAGKVVWPHPLVFFYPRWEIDAHDGRQYAYPIAALATLAILWRARNRIGRGPLAAVLMFAIALAPALGFLNVYPFRYSFVADHFQYHALMVLAALVVAAGATLLDWARIRSRWVGIALGVAVLLPLAVIAHRETYVFRDYVSLYSDVLEKNPRSWIAHINLADHLVQHGQTEEARPHYAEGLELLTSTNWRRGNLARAFEITGQLEEGIAQLSRDLAGDLTDRERAETFRRLGDILVLDNRTDEAIEQFQKSLEIEPQNAPTLANYGIVLADKGDYEKAVEKLQESLDMAPNNVRAQSRLGMSLRKLGKANEAIEALARAVQLNPNDGKTREELAIAFLMVDDQAGAVSQIQQALALDRRSSNAHNLLGTMLAQQGNFDTAIKAFELALELDPDNAGAAKNLKQIREHLEQRKNANAPQSSSTPAAANNESGAISPTASEDKLPATAPDESENTEASPLPPDPDKPAQDAPSPPADEPPKSSR
jgi:protein O-mannosyl-transferase